MLADHDQEARLLRQRMGLRLHVVLLAHMREQLLQRAWAAQVGRCLEVHPHEEEAGAGRALHVAELLGIDDVATRPIEDARDGIDDAFGVAAGKREDELVRSGHGFVEEEAWAQTLAAAESGDCTNAPHGRDAAL